MLSLAAGTNHGYWRLKFNTAFDIKTLDAIYFWQRQVSKRARCQQCTPASPAATCMCICCCCTLATCKLHWCICAPEALGSSQPPQNKHQQQPQEAAQRSRAVQQRAALHSSFARCRGTQPDAKDDNQQAAMHMIPYKYAGSWQHAL